MPPPLHCLTEIPKGSRNEDPDRSFMRELDDLPRQMRLEIVEEGRARCREERG